MTSCGVAFSGGGMRSAALCSGVLRYLLQHKIVFDYLSCVSGGGFTGAAYLDWKYRHNQQDSSEWHHKFFNHLRRRCGIFCSWGNPLIGIIDAVILLLLCVVVAIILPAFTSLAFAFPTAFAVDFLFGDILRAGFHCPTTSTNSSFSNPATENKGCTLVPNGSQDETFVLFGALFATSGGLYVLKFLFRPCRSSIHSKLELLYFISCSLFLMTFLPWFFEVFLRAQTSVYVNGFILLGSVFLWLGFPPLRNAASLALLVYAYAYTTKWRVYRSPVLIFSYSEDTFYKALLGSAVLLWISPFLGMIKMAAVHTYGRWRLQKAFFFTESTRCLGCAGISVNDCIPFCSCAEVSEWEELEKGYVTLGDLAGMNPVYLCNTVVNNWRREHNIANTGHEAEAFELLTLSPTGIERLDEDPDEHSSFAGKIHPRDLKLSDVTATSAAALALYMGVYDVRTETVRKLQMVLGIHFGKALVSDPSGDVAGSTFSYCRFLPALIQMLIVVPVILPPFLSNHWHVIVVSWYLAILVLVLFIASLSTGSENGGCLDKFVRWCTVNIYHVRFARLFLQTIDVGPVPPAILNLSDGGHIEGLGLLALLKKRLRKIVVIDGTTPGNGQRVSSQLLRSLELARKRLRCSFSAMDGRDITEDLRSKLDQVPPRHKPRFYKFRVEYKDKKGNTVDNEQTGKGEIMLILPRHPDEGTPSPIGLARSWEDYTRDTNQPMSGKKWGSGPDLEAGEVDRLTGCCCECCHVTCWRACCGVCCGIFPHHVTLNQFFTSAMYSAYHREGYRACLDAEIEHFFSDAEAGEKK
ncbi:unnamed protein product [Porites lobata]|uniref:PNPLA domain-containing protein n=1 Tax=Porites lobata TaxID=104759 RepID=A0ABN8P028_9CNID|nr:unnamed protein product [Porites lobata]